MKESRNFALLFSNLSRVLLFLVLACPLSSAVSASALVADDQRVMTLNGFPYWVTGSDPKTLQLIPQAGNNGLTYENSKVVAHVKFNVAQYGELSFPLHPHSIQGQEALGVDLRNSNFITIKYKSNHPVVLQLRQAGIHGGVHNHIILPAAHNVVTRKAYFSEFGGGLKPLDLSDVAKINFAFLGNNKKDGFAELVVTGITINDYNPLAYR